MEGRSRTTLSIDDEVYAEFQSHIRSLGIRRDAYLNRFLPAEVRMFCQLPTGSVRGPRLWKAIRQSQRRKLRKVSIRLTTSLLTEMNATCEEKGVLRDLFFEQFVRYANDSLGKALVYFENPSTAQGWTDERDRPYASLILSDDDVERLLEAATAVRGDDSKGTP